MGNKKSEIAPLPGDKVLEIEQPWAWAIFESGMDICSRPYFSQYEGLLWVLATTYSYPAASWIEKNIEITVPKKDELPEDAFIGRVTLCGTTQLEQEFHSYSSQWKLPGNLYHWVLKNPGLLPEPIYRKQTPLPEGLFRV